MSQTGRLEDLQLPLPRDLRRVARFLAWDAAALATASVVAPWLIQPVHGFPVLGGAMADALAVAGAQPVRLVLVGTAALWGLLAVTTALRVASWEEHLVGRAAAVTTAAMTVYIAFRALLSALNSLLGFLMPLVVAAALLALVASLIDTNR